MLAMTYERVMCKISIDHIANVNPWFKNLFNSVL